LIRITLPKSVMNIGTGAFPKNILIINE